MSAGVALCLLVAFLWLKTPARWPPPLAAVGGPAALALLICLVQARVVAEHGRIPAVTCVLSSGALGLLAASLPTRHRARAAVGLAIAVVLLAWVDALSLRALGHVVPLTSPGIVRQTWGALGSVPALLHARDLVFLVALVGALGLREAPASRGAWWCAVPAVLGLGWCAQRTRTMQENHEQVRSGYVSMHLLDLARGLGRERLRWSREEALVDARRELAKRPPDAEVPPSWRRPGASVLMIQLESFNAWAVGLELGGQPVTPVLDALARDNLSFTNTIAQVSRGRSSDADLLVHASLHPLSEGLAAFDVDPSSLVTLPRTLRERGYTTLSALADSPGFWNARVRHEGYGIQTSLFDADLGPGQVIGFGLADHLMFERVAPRIAALPRPYLAWLITLSTHHPFHPVPTEHRALDLGDLGGTSVGNYLDAVHYTDASIGALLRMLDDQQALTDTIVIIYADHDENNFREPERARALAAPRAPGHPDPTRQIPLLVRLPGPPVAAQINEPTGLIDLAPTLLSILQIPRPSAFLGHPRAPGIAAPLRRHDGLSMEPSGWLWARDCTLPTGCDEARAALRSELLLSRNIALLGLGPSLGSTQSPPLPPAQ